MSKTESRRRLGERNQRLKASSNELKIKKQNISDHLAVLLKRAKQMQVLKKGLENDLMQCQEQARVNRNKKVGYVGVLEGELAMLDEECKIESLSLAKVEDEYQICLQDYDHSLAVITNAIEEVKILEAQVIQERESSAQMQAMIFDYQRLRRVLEEERKYFIELSNSENKSHAQRVTELQQIRNKLAEEAQFTEGLLKHSKFRAGFCRLDHLYRQRLRQYAQTFLREEYAAALKTQLSIRIFSNCLSLANSKHLLTTRKLFYRWHHNVFPKYTLSKLTQNALRNDIDSHCRLSTLNKLTEEVNSRNLELFHLFEKGKYLLALGCKVSRKDMQYGFNRWRDNYHTQTIHLNSFSKLFNKTIPKYELRTSFRIWKHNSYFTSRFQRANFLLDQFLTTKQLSRVFRKWRLQVPLFELNSINSYMRNIKMRNQLAKRINYEKRKSRALTILSFRLEKIKLRNYFIRYWANAKTLAVGELRTAVATGRDRFSELRAQQKLTSAEVAHANKINSLKVFRKFMFNSKLKPAFKIWYNTSKSIGKRSEALLHLSLRKCGKIKMLVMNELRRVVQHHEKKQMHQVLTDLNNKMEAINEKSTNFRERLRKCVDELGQMASKLIGQTFNDAIRNKQRLLFHTDLRYKIKTLYTEYLLHRLNLILSHYCSKGGFDKLTLYSKWKLKKHKSEQAEKKFKRLKDKRRLATGFYCLKGLCKCHKVCFRKMTQSQNILMFWRTASAFLALQRKSHAEAVKAKNKQISSSQLVLHNKSQNLSNLHTQLTKLENNLQSIFQKFLMVQDRSMVLKDRRLTQQQAKRYFMMFRQNVEEQLHKQKVVVHFSSLISHKNNIIFWKGCTALYYDNKIAVIKQELGQVNRKKKSHMDKSGKGKGDIEKRVSESEQTHASFLSIYQYYQKKFEGTIQFYRHRHSVNHNRYYMKEIFMVWRAEAMGAKRLALGANQVLQRNLVYPAYQVIFKIYKREQLQFKSQLLCAQFLQRKGRNCMRDSLLLWRCNMRKLQCEQLEATANRMITQKNKIIEESKRNAQLISIECARIKRLKIYTKIFMTLKSEWTQQVYLQNYKIKPLRNKSNSQLVRRTMDGLKWLVFFKKTKRNYLRFKQQKYEKELKEDVFYSLKGYLQMHYAFVEKIDGVVGNVRWNFTRHAFSKIINVGAEERNQLTYQRRRALRVLVMNKVTKAMMVKRRIIAKWHAWLIPRTHYLPVILKSCETVILRQSFAKMREHAYWNPIYISSAADKITSEGYSDVTAATNNLVKEGYDPDEIKAYLTEMNNKDTVSIRRVVNRIRVWHEKQGMVRAWNSWKQYLQLKMRIKKSLAKVLMIAQGIGRYWNRWKSKNPQFNAILERESRGNMLSRYRDLGRLLKEYKRDIKDSNIYCEQLKQINDEYAREADQGVRMALSTFSKQLKTGLRQAMDIWRRNTKRFRVQSTDHQYDQLSSGIELLLQQKKSLRERVIMLRQQNAVMKSKCNLGAECGDILKKLLKERDCLSIDLADKEHNLKLLLEDNLRLKQKIKAAKNNAEKLIHQVQQQEY